jgi:CrcB protein
VTELRSLLLVAFGGALGSAARYAVGGWVHASFPRVALPIGTLAVNTSGCFVIGVLAALVEVRQLLSPQVRLLLMIGVLGGFTTFSSFALETLALARDAQFARALSNAGAQLALGLAAVWLGYSLVRP